MSINVLALIGATLSIATPLVWAAIGELIVERTGVLNLGIEGTMYAGAFVGFVTAHRSGSPWLGLATAILAGVLAGLAMGLFSVTRGVNQHVAGLGITLLRIATSDFVLRLLSICERRSLEQQFTPLLRDVPVLDQHWLTYAGFLLLAPAVWWLLRSTGLGYRTHAVGESFEAAEVAGISVNRTRYLALAAGGACMAIGGAY